MAGGGRADAVESPGDCSLELTNPSEEYAPGNIYEITVVVHRLESQTGMDVFPDFLARYEFVRVYAMRSDYHLGVFRRRDSRAVPASF